MDDILLADAPAPDTTIEQAAPEPSRRAGMSKVAAAFLAGMGPVGLALVSGPAKAQSVTDVDILNFALNLEYIEAEFYLRAVTGAGLSNTDITGTGPLGGVNGGSPVPFTTPVFAQYAANLAVDEQTHVRFLRSALGSAAVARPLIDLAGGFQGAAVAAGVTTPAVQFNPFADQTSFFQGAFIFEDVGVTAYAGAAALLQNKTYVAAAASILAVEGYHGGMIRTVLGQIGGAVPFNTQAIANLRSQASKMVDDVGVLIPSNGSLNIAPTDGNGLAFRRTTAQVVNIVTNGRPGQRRLPAQRLQRQHHQRRRKLAGNGGRGLVTPARVFTRRSPVATRCRA